MNGLNKVFLLGSLGAKPELRYTQGGTPVLSLRLATNERYQNKEKEWVDRTEWHSCTVFGARAEGLSKVLDKGSSMLVEGSIRTSKYEKDGSTRYKTEIIVNDVHLTGGLSHDGEDGAGQGDDGEGAPPARGGGGQRAQQAPRQPSGGGGGGAPTDDFEVRYGNDKGKMMTEVTDLSWLRGTLVKDLADASKSRFHGKAQTQLAAIDAELARRGSGCGGGASRPARSSGGGGYAPRGGRQAPPAEPEAPQGGGDDFDFDGGYGGEDSDIPF
jgi:single-strand DNA-binding protein